MTNSELVRENVETFMRGIRKWNPGELEYHQAVQEVIESLMPFLLAPIGFCIGVLSRERGRVLALHATTIKQKNQ